MFEKFAETVLEDLVKPSARGLFRLFAVVVIASTALYCYEAVTGHFFLSGLERRIAILKELNSLRDTGIESHPNLAPMYVAAESDLKKFRPVPLRDFYPDAIVGTPQPRNPVTLLMHAGAGALLGLLLLTSAVFSALRRRKARDQVKVAAVLILLGATVGALLPSTFGYASRICIASLFASASFGFVALFGANIRKTFARAAQGEAKANLKALHTTLRAHLGEKDHYPTAVADWEPLPGGRYVYFLSGNRPIGEGRSEALKAAAIQELARLGIHPFINPTEYLAAAVGKIGGNRLDVWVIDNAGEPTNRQTAVP